MPFLNFIRLFWMLALIVAIFLVVRSLPPNEITIKSGPKTYFFDSTAQHIKKEMEKIGVRTTVINTNKTLKIVEDVNQNTSSIDIGFAAQDLSKQNIPNIESLGSILIEPLFIFYRKELKLTSPADLKGLKLGIGPTGDGTRTLAEKVLGKFGVNPQNANFFPISQLESIKALEENLIDVGFFLQPTETPFIRSLGNNRQLSILHIESSKALSRRIDYLHDITIPRGAFSLRRNKPSKDTFGVGLPVTVVANKNIDPSIAVMVSYILKKKFGAATLISDSNTFPRSLEPRLNLNSNTEKVLSNGLPYVFSVLPFSIAGLLYNIGLPLISLIGLAIVFNAVYRFIGFLSPLELWQKRRYRDDLSGVRKILSNLEERDTLTSKEEKFVRVLRTRYDAERISFAQIKPDPIIKNAHSEINQLLNKIKIVDKSKGAAV